MAVDANSGLSVSEESGHPVDYWEGESGLSHLCEEVVVIDEVEVTFNVKC
jgi:hypothetical protein